MGGDTERGMDGELNRYMSGKKGRDDGGRGKVDDECRNDGGQVHEWIGGQMNDGWMDGG